MEESPPYYYVGRPPLEAPPPQQFQVAQSPDGYFGSPSQRPVDSKCNSFLTKCFSCLDRGHRNTPTPNPVQKVIRNIGNHLANCPFRSCFCMNCENSLAKAVLGIEKRLENAVDNDGRLVEEVYINGHAMFMGYMSMGVRGLGFLVVTWTTVVLLGGFVSDLGEKDFWSLMGITLVEIVGVFDVFRKEKLYDIWDMYRSFNILTMRHTLDRPGDDNNSDDGGGDNISNRKCICLSLSLILPICAKVSGQGLVIGLILLPVLALYLCGMYFCIAISLWRLVQHDYYNIVTNGAKNLKPALDILYYLVLVQGGPFCYRAYYALQEKKYVKIVVQVYGFRSMSAVEDYLRETKNGCEKDPSFAKGKTLVTYAVKLLESSSLKEYLTGIMILNTLIEEKRTLRSFAEKKENEQLILIKQLVGLASNRQMPQKLQATADANSPYDENTQRCAKNILHFLDSRNAHCGDYVGSVSI